MQEHAQLRTHLGPCLNDRVHALANIHPVEPCRRVTFQLILPFEGREPEVCRPDALSVPDGAVGGIVPLE